tara:strand:+ start:2508 stop:2900 length:393 start_codon:yes stop_codon:yes gene_type:complete
MIILCIILIPILILIIWLIVRKKWKKLILTIVGLTTLIILGWYLFLGLIAAFKNNCEITGKWEIGEYEIIKQSCIGFAGPPWNEVYLYQDNKIVDKILNKSDSCIVKFQNSTGDSLQFDLCDHKMTKLKK